MLCNIIHNYRGITFAINNYHYYYIWYYHLYYYYERYVVLYVHIRDFIII